VVSLFFRIFSCFFFFSGPVRRAGDRARPFSLRAAVGRAGHLSLSSWCPCGVSPEPPRGVGLRLALGGGRLTVGATVRVCSFRQCRAALDETFAAIFGFQSPLYVLVRTVGDYRRCCGKDAITADSRSQTPNATASSAGEEATASIQMALVIVMNVSMLLAEFSTPLGHTSFS
jgi:hypothetical protein